MEPNTITNQLVSKTAKYVSQLFNNNFSEKLLFHNINHTKYVVEKVEVIGKHSNLSESEINLLKICAWFHDIGYLTNIENHEEESFSVAKKFLEQNNLNQDYIKQVKKCILATKSPQKPTDYLSEILCDADLAHLAEDDYFERINLLRKEQSLLLNTKISKQKFHKNSVLFINQHQYFSAYAKKEYNSKKEIILNKIKKNIQMLTEEKERKKKKKKKGYSRGVESMFRNTARMQINLSSIADKKSNILISVNTIIISITTTLMVSKFEETPKIILPTIVFLSFSLITIIFAILSTRPNVSSGKFSIDDVKKNKANLLFFGNFYDMELEEYEVALKMMMNDDKKLYSALILDQYSLGKVLAKKYKLLRIAYNLFMIGIVVSVLVFIIAFINL